MQIEDKRFETLEKTVNDLSKKVGKIYVWSIGDEFHPNGIDQRVNRLEKKDKEREKRWWITLGGITVLLFLMKWGDKIIEKLL